MKRLLGIGGHQRVGRGRSDEWLTPPEILQALGPFDLDPCAPADPPWPLAYQRLTKADDGLAQPWYGRVWLNPPYGPATGVWLKRMVEHGNGIALTFARTDTAAFHAWVWPHAGALLFLEGRLHFYSVDGERARQNCGGPSVLIAYGPENVERLRFCGLKGHYLKNQRRRSS